jgi:hypothetical protein
VQKDGVDVLCAPAAEGDVAQAYARFDSPLREGSITFSVSKAEPGSALSVSMSGSMKTRPASIPRPSSSSMIRSPIAMRFSASR